MQSINTTHSRSLMVWKNESLITKPNPIDVAWKNKKEYKNWKKGKNILRNLPQKHKLSKTRKAGSSRANWFLVSIKTEKYFKYVAKKTKQNRINCYVKKWDGLYKKHLLKIYCGKQKNVLQYIFNEVLSLYNFTL